jgi:hypothetical protein
LPELRVKTDYLKRITKHLSLKKLKMLSVKPKPDPNSVTKCSAEQRKLFFDGKSSLTRN